MPTTAKPEDTRLSSNHLDRAHERLSRDLRPLPAPTIARRPDTIVGYDPHPCIKAEVAV